MTIKQKDAVFSALQAASEQGLEGNVARDFAVEQVKAGLMSGEVQYGDGPIADETKAKTYAKALVGNWMKKDIRLTNGQKYEPATKRGPLIKDEKLKELKEAIASLKVHGAPADLLERTQAAYDARKAELDASKKTAKVKSLDETMAALEALGITG